ncbi:IS1634 family transposase [Geochorda subterranea]|uniref:IS1634 family transposase n=1 Tax=Geochorda subterranea TaxID=3109564 RepID=A0ABZ1BNX0_9FIRM|nr:IS1634 family transposase [Limnochorda sp. LNt]WRP14529.1 IS1634 family transposase [Limnochorda sp. LNt]
MYVRTVTSKGIQYAQLAHNVRDPKTGQPRAQVLYTFGRVDQLDLDALRRLVRSIARFLPPDEQAQLQKDLGMEWPFRYLGSLKLGGTWLLDGLWRRLGIQKTLQRLLEACHYQTPIERLLFAMVANRALAPSSKLAIEKWVAQDVYIDQLPAVEVHQLYRAMDFLLEAAEAIQREVFWTLANLFNLEVDVIFFDTTTAYFEIEGEDADGLRRWGHSADDHPKMAQVVIGLAVTRDGIPVRCWVWPGNTGDQNVVAEVKRDLNGWKLNRVVVVLDTGFNSEANRRILQGAGDHYIIGEKLRVGPQGVPAEALRRGGKYRRLPDGLEIKEVVVGGDSAARRRFVIVRNPEEAERDRQKRESILAELRQRLEALKQKQGEAHTKAACELRAHETFGRYLRQTRGARLVIDAAKVRREAALDGKFVISSSDDFLPAEDLVYGYKQLWQVERVHRDLKHTVDVRPMYHRLDDRIRSHVLLCWLALLMIRVAENETGQTWRQMRDLVAPIDVGRHATAHGEVWQVRPLTEEQKALFQALKVDRPPHYLKIVTPTRKTA